MGRKPARIYAIAAIMGALAACASSIGCGGATDGGTNSSSSSSGGGSRSGSGTSESGSGTPGSSPAEKGAPPSSSSGSLGSGSSTGGAGTISNHSGNGSADSNAGDGGDDATMAGGGVANANDGAPPDAISGDEGPPSDATLTPPPSTYGIVFNPMYSAFIPVADGGQSGSTVSPDSPSPFEPTDGGPGPACTNCHGPTATQGAFLGMLHTPEQTAGFSDQELIDIVVNGIIPQGWHYNPTIIPCAYWQWFHKWRDLTPEQERGIVVYIRSLTPTSQGPKVDFGGALAGP